MTDEKLLRKLMSGREYRKIDIEGIELRSGDDGELTVEGYATTFNQPYLLYKGNDWEIREQVDPNAFDECDTSDVIFQYDHTGRVMARTRNKTLELACDSHGLKIRAYLGGTEAGRQLYEEIKGGYIDRMSFGFTVRSDKRVEETVDGNYTVYTRTITGFEKLYDVSAVSIPANDATEISARSYADGVIAELTALEQRREEERQNRERKREEIRKMLTAAGLAGNK